MLFRRLNPGGRLKPGETVPQRFRQFVHRFRVPLSILGAGSVGYVAYNFDRAPVTHRWRIQAFSIPAELELAQQIEIEDTSSATMVSEKTEVYRTTYLMLHLLLAQAEALFLHPEDQGKIPWKIRIIDSPVVNAYCGPGGNIVVYTGLIDFCARAQQQGKVKNCAAALSGVLCHEISHGIARHAMESLSWMPFITVGVFVLEAFFFSLGFSGNEVFLLRDLLNFVAQLIVRLPHSRTLESEADLIACAILAAAQFPTDDFPRMLALLADANSMVASGKKKTAEVPEILSTHPDSKRRAKEAQSYLAGMPVLYEPNEQVEEMLLHAAMVYSRFSRARFFLVR